MKKAPKFVAINGQQTSNWNYDEQTGNVTVNVPVTPTSEQTVVAISQSEGGIVEIKNLSIDSQYDSDFYDLQGRKLSNGKSSNSKLPNSKLPRGFYITNGKIVGR